MLFDMRILVMEDDAEAAAYLAKGLRESGYLVEHASDGMDGLYMATSEDFDLLIVDRMLPKLDGLAVIEALRKSGLAIPVLILSALGEVDDRVRGLRAGGDDYLTKPYAFAELLARIEALLRRPRDNGSSRREYRLLAHADPARLGPGVGPDHAARERLRDYHFAPDQRHRRPYQPPAPEARSQRLTRPRSTPCAAPDHCLRSRTSP